MNTALIDFTYTIKLQVIIKKSTIKKFKNQKGPRNVARIFLFNFQIG